MPDICEIAWRSLSGKFCSATGSQLQSYSHTSLVMENRWVFPRLNLIFPRKAMREKVPLFGVRTARQKMRLRRWSVESLCSLEGISFQLLNGQRRAPRRATDSCRFSSRARSQARKLSFIVLNFRLPFQLKEISRVGRRTALQRSELLPGC